MQKDNRAIAIYSRKSKFTGKGESIGNQVELCKAYIRNGLGTPADQCIVYEDEGFSGGNLKRPDFQKMMDAVRKRRIKAIVVYRLDRISRNISDFAGLIEELTRLEVSFVSIREQFDTATPMGRAMMFIISVFSQLERETIAERIRDNMQELAKTGRWLGGNTPLGFKSEAVHKMTIDGKSRSTYRLAAVSEEAQIPKLIFALYEKLDSLTGVEAQLLRRGIKTKQGKSFTRFAIKSILQNPVYMRADEAAFDYFVARDAEVCFPKEAFDGQRGIMAYHRTRQEKGKTTVLLPISQWIIAIGQHEPLVDSRQWIKVQQSLERNKTKEYRKARRNEAILTGVLFCACGSRMYPKLSNRKTENGQTSYTYVCKLKERSKGECCSFPNVHGNELDERILGQIKLLQEDAACFAAQLEKHRCDFSGNEGSAETELAACKAASAENEKIITSLIDALGLATDTAAKDRLLRRIEDLSEVNRKLDIRKQELEEAHAIGALDEKELGAQLQMFSCVDRCIDQMTTEQKRAAVRTLIGQVRWDGETAHVVFTGAAEEMRWCEDSK